MTRGNISIDAVKPLHRIGYVRITSLDDDEVIQQAAMRTAGCYCIFEDISPASRKKRPALAALLESLTSGDTLIVWRLDHLDMTARQLVLLLDRFKRQNIDIMSIQDKIDTTTSAGSSMLQISAVMAEMDRRVITDRAVERVTVTELPRGRPTILSKALLEDIERLMADPVMSAADVAKQVGVSRATIYRALTTLRALSRLPQTDNRSLSAR